MLLGVFITQTIAARTADALFGVLDSFLGDAGVEVWSYHVLAGHLKRLNLEKGFIFNTFPDDWVARYRSMRYFEVDPIIDHAREASAPYAWWSLADRPKLDAAARAYLADARDWLGDGYGVPVHGAHGTTAYFGIGTLRGRPLALEAEDLAAIQLACVQTHTRFLQLNGAIEAPPPTLTPREREVLGWVVRGKSNAVIADVLGISEHTVDTLMRRIYRKFEVTDRTSAALRAVGAGLIPA